MAAPKKISIDPEIIEKTECDKDFICLTSDQSIYCSVANTLGDSMVQLECCDLVDCRHNKLYGSLHLCKCPVRNEIFKKYGL